MFKAFVLYIFRNESCCAIFNFRTDIFDLICFLNLSVREKVSFKSHAQRFEGDSFKKMPSVLKAPRLKFSKKVLARLSMYNMLLH